MFDTFRNRGLALLGAIVILTGLLAACGGGSASDDDLRNELKTMMMQEDAMTEEEAECFSDIMVEEIDNDVLRDAIDSGEDNPDMPAEAATAMDRAFTECFDLDDLMENLDPEADDQ